MCGIGGIARLDGQDLPDRVDSVLDSLLRILDHRGPDDNAVLRDGPVGLAFTRLSLVAPEHGNQPLVSPDGNLVLVANGEVYNHRELEARLPAGTTMTTGSDCEVLLHLYQQHGLDFLRDVNGMFAVILWDRARGQLVLARDRFGIKPLYYHRNAERVIASSEIKGLFADGDTPRAFNWAGALATPMAAAAPCWNESPVQTWFDDVHCVPAASILRIDLHDGRTETDVYWELPTADTDPAPRETYVRDYRDLLENSVRDCATADTELGLFLSGGIDSSAVLTLAAPHVEVLHTFTALTGGTRENGDSPNAAATAADLDIVNHQVLFPASLTPTPEEWMRLVWLVESPVCGPEVYYKHELHRFARHTRPELRGMLLGAASDEFNGGYSDGVLGSGSWQSFLDSLTYLDRSTTLARTPSLSSWWGTADPVVRPPATAGPSDVYQRYLASEYLKVQQYNVWHEDRTAAGSGIEARVPFLDHRLVEVAARVPSALRADLLFDKRILREAMRGRLPARVTGLAKGPFFYGSGVGHAYRMIIRLLRADDYELLERAAAAPGASDVIDFDRARTEIDSWGDTSDSPRVELMLHLVNMGLLAAMAADPPVLEDMSPGPVRDALPPRTADPVQRTVALFPDPARAVLPEADETFLDADVRLLRDVHGGWFVAVAGELEYEFDEDAAVLRVLRQLATGCSLAEATDRSGVDAADVQDDLVELAGQGVLVHRVPDPVLAGVGGPVP